MGALHKSAAALRVMGDGLDPDEISQRLGSQPSLAYRKGDTCKFRTGSIIRKSGMWSLDASDQEPADLDAQIAGILGRLTDDAAIWGRLSAAFTVDVFCGCFMHGTDEGLTLSPGTMRMLADRGITLQLCLYAPLPEAESKPCPPA